MTREIKFRGKRVNSGKWVYGDLRQDKDLETAYINGWDYWSDHESGLQRDAFEFEVIPESVGQFIGRCDRFKPFESEIYEGDRLKAWRSVGANGQLRREYPRPLLVEYNDYNGQYELTDNQLKESYPLQYFEAFEILEVQP